MHSLVFVNLSSHHIFHQSGELRYFPRFSCYPVIRGEWAVNRLTVIRFSPCPYVVLFLFSNHEYHDCCASPVQSHKIPQGSRRVPHRLIPPPSPPSPQEDMDVLIKTADADADGRISLEDFRNMLNFKCVCVCAGASWRPLLKGDRPVNAQKVLNVVSFQSYFIILFFYSRMFRKLAIEVASVQNLLAFAIPNPWAVIPARFPSNS